MYVVAIVIAGNAAAAAAVAVYELRLLLLSFIVACLMTCVCVIVVNGWMMSGWSVGWLRLMHHLLLLISIELKHFGINGMSSTFTKQKQQTRPLHFNRETCVAKVPHLYLPPICVLITHCVRTHTRVREQCRLAKISLLTLIMIMLFYKCKFCCLYVCVYVSFKEL